MSQSPSLHFVPQWLKKPSGPGTPPANTPLSPGGGGNAAFAFGSAPSISASSVPPSLNKQAGSKQAQQQQHSHSSAAPTPTEPRPAVFEHSYSQIAGTREHQQQQQGQHTLHPGSYDANSPSALPTNGSLPRPFQYSKEELLSFFNESSVQDRPVELVLDGGHGVSAGTGMVILADRAGKPVGLTHAGEEERKLLANPVRRQPTHPDGSLISTPGAIGSHTGRRPLGDHRPSTGPGAATFQSPSVIGNPPRDRDRDRALGFGRTEIGQSPSGAANPVGAPRADRGDKYDRNARDLWRGDGEERKPVGGHKQDARDPRKPKEPLEGDQSQRPTSNLTSASSWRPAPRQGSGSGNFEGVLGFGGPAAPATRSEEPPNTSLGWRERQALKEKSTVISAAPGGERGLPSSGGGPGWSRGGGRWRAAATQDEEEKRPSLSTIIGEDGSYPRPSVSTSVVPPETPRVQRDQAVEDVQSQTESQHSSQSSGPPPGFAVAAVEITPENTNWYYTDPAGLQQGPFLGTQMQGWFTGNYFSDSLPLRRETETEYRTLSVIKEETGDAVKPFLARSRPQTVSAPPSVQIEVPVASRYTNGNGNLRDILSGQNDPLGRASPSSHLARADIFGAPSPVGSPFAVNRVVEPYRSHTSSPVHQQGTPIRSVWDNAAIGSNIASPSANLDNQFQPLQHQQQGFSAAAQPVGGNRSIFDMTQQHRIMPTPNIFGPQPTQQPQPWNIPQQLGGFPQPVFQQQPNQMPYYHDQQPQQIPFGQIPVNFNGPAVNQMPFGQQQQQQGFAAPSQGEVAQQEQIRQASFDVQTVPQTSDVFQKAPASHETVTEVVALVSDDPEFEKTPKLAASEPVVDLAEVLEQIVIVPSQAPEAISQPSKKERRPSTLPDPPSSLPTKPTAAKESKKKTATVPAVAAPVVVETEVIAIPVEAPSSAPPKTAPWAPKDVEKAKTPTGPSLREIQDAEAKRAEAKKVAEARARATAAAAAVLAGGQVEDTDLIQSMSWGLSSQRNTSSPAPSAPTTPAWGSSDAAPKKTLKQIQEEEERRAKLVAQAKAKTAVANGGPAAAASAASAAKRGYADLAATVAPASPTASGAWATVGAGGKAVSSPNVKVSTPKTPMTPVPAVKLVSVSTVPKAIKADINDVAPSIELIRWTKEALKGLKNVNMDDFVQMLFTFPVEPAPTSRAEQLEIISDSVYANSATLDGRRFAQDFYTKRKADAQAKLAGGNIMPAASRGNSLADIVKTQPKAAANDFGGFKVVKAKGKGKK